jgi:hypothetical protein
LTYLILKGCWDIFLPGLNVRSGCQKRGQQQNLLRP